MKLQKWIETEKKRGRETSVRDLYNKIAGVYDITKDYKIIGEITKKKIISFLPNLKRKTILDVGCGTGKWIKYFISKGATATGVDFSKDMLEIAKKNKKATFALMDATKLKFPDNRFDVTFSNLVLTQIKNSGKALKEMIRVTKRGGYIVLCNINIVPKAGEKYLLSIFHHGKDVLLSKSYPVTFREIFDIARKNDCELVDFFEVKMQEWLDKMGIKDKSDWTFLNIIKLRKK